MKTQFAVLLTGAALIALFPFAMAAELPEPEAVEDPELAADHEFWGHIEAGWRFFIERPSSGFGFDDSGRPLTAKETESRAGFERFGEIPPGPFLNNLYLGAATADGRFVGELWAKNAGYNDQNYQLRLMQPGQHYFFFEWDELPFLFSTSGKTLYNTTDPTRLTIAPGIRQDLEALTTPPPTNPTDAQAAAVREIINSNVRRIELSTQRDTAKVAYAFTPTPAWDFQVSYSHERKTGTVGLGTTLNHFAGARPHNPFEVPAPVDFTTQNFGATAQYKGSYGDNKKYNVSFTYAGSLFSNEHESFTFDNPFRFSDPHPDTRETANRGRHSLAPDNHAHRYGLTTGIDLPYNSRYMGTFSFNQMRQNEDFIPKTINPTLLPLVAPLPASSANAKIDQLQFNNVLTTRLTSNLTSTLRYRYYDHDNRTPILLFDDYVRADGNIVTTDRQNLATSYIRQNASADLRWRMWPELNLGATYGWERFDRDRREVDVTDEHSGKIYADANPFDWVRVRASYLHAQRRFNDYDALERVGRETYNPPEGTGFAQNPLLRKFDVTDRDRHKVNVSMELTTPIEGLFLMPNFRWRDDRFSDRDTTGGDLGLKKERAWNAGIEMSYVITPHITLSAGYLYEDFNRQMVSRHIGPGSTCPIPAGQPPIGTADCNWGSNIVDAVDTVYGALNFALLPDSLDFRMGYTYSRSTGETRTRPLGADGRTSDPPFPDIKNNYHRLDAVLSHKVDPDLVSRLGWTGDVTAKLGYVFEYNRMTNWQFDDIVPYMRESDPSAGRSLLLAAYNPNYTAHFVGLSFAFDW